MLTFNEYLKSRDALLYEQLLSEGMFDNVKGYLGKATPYLAAAAGTGLAALGAGGVYNAVKGSTPAVQPKQNTTQVAQTAQVSPQSITNIDKQYAPEEILIKKVVIPKDLIRGAQPNQQKWDRDFANLSTDYTGDQGLATRKDNFEKPSLMYVVKKDALNRVLPGAGAYAIRQNGLPIIVLPDEAFKSLPTATSNGVPTDWGKSILAHELRHNTQDFSSTPLNRDSNAGKHLKGSISDQESDYGKHYRNDPAEMGVRLAALKNLVSQENIESIADSMPATEGIIIKKMLQLANGNEKDLFTLVMSNGNLKYRATVDPETKQLFAGIFSPEFDPKNEELKKSIDDSLKTLRDKLGEQNDDAGDLLQFYNKIPLEKRGEFFKELIDGYDRVVKSSDSRSTGVATA